jgi:hypothetical protein
LFGNIAQFFFGQGRIEPDAFRSYLESRPVTLLESLERIVPESLHDELDISGWRWECNAHLYYSALGHEFETDVVKLEFRDWIDPRRSFWFSLLYALLEGLSGALDVERQDINGCLYTPLGSPDSRVLVLFDDVPGGAGHVRRLARKDALSDVLKESLHRLELCDCGSEEDDTSCYGCLRNYRNQFYHDDLKRGMVIEFLRRVLS